MMTITEAAQQHHQQLFPGHVSTLQTIVPELVECFDNWAFDEVLAEGNLDARLRLMPQLAAHVAGNLAIGNDRPVLIDTLTQLLPYIGYPRTLNALRVVNEGTTA